MNLEELGRRAVACPRWRWMSGCAWMWAQSHGRMNKGRVPDFGSSIPGDAVPDLSDPATLGCLVALVEEAWKCPIDMSFAGACRFDVDAEERVYPQDHTVSFAAKTRVEALVAALEAAP